MALMPDGANGSREVILTPEWEYGGATLRDVGEAGTSFTKQQWHRQNLHSQKQEYSFLVKG